MKRSGTMLLLVAALATTACNEKETRSGQLTLAGTAPVRIASTSGGTVEFYTGPLKVEFNVDGRDAKIILEQSGRKAELKARVPRNADWNVTLKGSDIGQPVDLASTRRVEHYGPEFHDTRRQSCGMGGHETIFLTLRKANEYWDVAFNDSATGQAVGAFKSSILGYDDVIRENSTGCIGERDRGGRWDHVKLQNKLDELKETGVKFE